jgi:predicted nucleic acid-binding protein
VGTEPEARQDLKIILCDTGPLLHLREAGCLDLLKPAGRVLIPPAVQTELMDNDPSWEKGRPRWIEVRTLDPEFLGKAARWLQAGLLDPGEAEAVSLALQLGADWLLTDDAAARLIAQQQGLEVHGSLGVILWAAAVGNLQHPEADGALEALSRSSLWISARVLEEARAALRQIFA